MASLEAQRQHYMDEEMGFIIRRHPLFALKIEPYKVLPFKNNVDLERFKKPSPAAPPQFP